MPRSRAKPTELYRSLDTKYIQRMGNLVGIRALLDERWGVGQWDRDKLVDLLLERQSDKGAIEASAVRKAVGARRDRGKVIAAKAEAYRLAFPNVTPNDEVLITQLCEIEVQLDELTDDQAAAVASQDGDTIEDKSKRGKLRLSLVAEHRRIQNELGISRAQRSDEINAAEIIAGYGAAAKKLLAERSVRIECPRCKGQHAINQGFILFHFAKHVPWTWTSTCPNPDCGAILTIVSGKAKASDPILLEVAHG